MPGVDRVGHLHESSTECLARRSNELTARCIPDLQRVRSGGRIQIGGTVRRIGMRAHDTCKQSRFVAYATHYGGSHLCDVLRPHQANSDEGLVQCPACGESGFPMR